MVGRLAPAIVALMVTPKLIHLMGLPRWGVFTIALSLVGTFGIFDFGLGRALTRTIADRAGEDPEHEVADLTLTGITVLGGIGLIAGAIIAVLVNGWVTHGLKVPPGMELETKIALWVLCATAPLVMVNAAMWGVMCAYHAFRAANLVNVPISVMYYVGPLLSLLVWDSLIGVILSLAACRLWMTFSYLRICLRLMPALKKARVRPRLLVPLLHIGGWMTVSNIAYPVLNYFDRFVVATVISAAATSFYTTPSDVVGRFSLLTNAVTGAAFPAFASSWRKDEAHTVELFRTTALTMGALLFVPCLWCALFSYEFLALWIDPGFAAQSSVIMKLLCVGVFISGVDAVAAGFLDGIGRPDVSARLSIGEILLYMPLLYVSLKMFGITGAAVAWTLRETADFVVRSILCIRLYRPLRRAVGGVLPASLTGYAILCVALIHMSPLTAFAVGTVLSAVFYGLMWFVCLNEPERDAFRGFLSRLLSRLTRSRTA